MTEERHKKKIKTEDKNQENKEKVQISKDKTKNKESIKDDSNNLDNIQENSQPDNLLNQDSWEPESSCWGCREGQPNQLAHMDPQGGCLYQGELEDE